MSEIDAFGDFREEWSRLGPSLPPDDPNDKSHFRPTGIVTGTALGLASGIGDLVLKGMGMATAVAPISADFMLSNVTGERQTSLQDKYFSLMDTASKAVDKVLVPRPEEYTLGGETMYSLARGIAPIGLAAVNPLAGVGALVATTTMKTGTDLVDAGASSNVALAGGLLQGATMAVGAGVPAVFGKGLIVNLASAVGVNNVIGSLSRVAMSEMLKANGHPDLAEQYGPSVESSLVDTALGLAFGTLHYIGGKAVQKSALDDAVSTIINNHSASESGPGLPADVHSQQGAVDALKKAIDQINEGKKVDVAQEMQGTKFIPLPETEVSKAINEENSSVQKDVLFSVEPLPLRLKTEKPPALMPFQDPLTGEQRLISPQDADSVLTEFEAKANSEAELLESSDLLSCIQSNAP